MSYNWIEQAGIIPSDISGGDFFGNSVAIYGNTCVIGARQKDASGVNSGKAYIYIYDQVQHGNGKQIYYQMI